jgi:hypothetical protein
MVKIHYVPSQEVLAYISTKPINDPQSEKYISAVIFGGIVEVAHSILTLSTCELFVNVLG